MRYLSIINSLAIMILMAGCQSTGNFYNKNLTPTEISRAKTFKDITDVLGNYHLVNAKKRDIEFLHVNLENKKVGYVSPQAFIEFSPKDENLTDWTKRIAFQLKPLNTDRNKRNIALKEHIDRFNKALDKAAHIKKEEFKILVNKKAPENVTPENFARFKYIEKKSKHTIHTATIMFTEKNRLTTMYYLKKDEPISEKEIKKLNKILYVFMNMINKG